MALRDMDNNAKIISLKPALAIAPADPVAIEPSPPQIRDIPAQDTRYRLVIEEGPTPGTFVYKTFNSETGEIIRQFPRDKILELANTPNYGSGSVIDTTA